MAVRPQGRRKPNKLRFFVLFTALIVVGVGAVYGLHWAANPWALSLPGRPALTGHWQGTVPYGPADDRRIVLRLDDDPPSATDRCGDCPGMVGVAKVCTAGDAETYELWGDARNYRGTRFSLHTRPEAEGPGPHLNELHGEWDGDLVRIRTSLTTLGADGTTIGSDSPPVTFEMTRADEDDLDRLSCR
ncbi:hypothetical protein E1211_19180 [Micromonospora sp. 15K316]|uniref:hypothetical protein n=1 Tax=Micromonospora sp. 15K316 TaxID=2530376 RepID=UPI0010532828|nr:hypothetical protein [Micromonospora sp. 15K316]TDC33439.1 hypothetical protein E1211_19180 [Micromonospora sp. 15K316]